MFDILFNLSIKELVLINIVLIVLSLAVTFIIRSLSLKKYEKNCSVEETIYFQQKSMRYSQFIILIITVFLDSLILAPFTDPLGSMAFPVIIGICYIIVFIILAGNSLILFNLNRMLRKTSSTRKEQLGMLVKVFLFSVVPFMLLICLIAVVSGSFSDYGIINDILKWSVIALLYLVFSMIMPLFTKYLLKAKPIDKPEISDVLTSFAEKTGLRNTSLYLWPMRNNRHANALVTGLIRKDIIISDYLLDNLKIDEVKAILAHEIGHIKKHHLWIRTGLILGLFIILGVMEYIMDTYIDFFTETTIWIGVGLFLVIWFSYIGFISYFIKRIQERQADAYTIELGINPETNIRALYKITRLNRMVMKYGKFDEKLQTHPSTAKRILWLAEKGNISADRIEEIKNEADEEIAELL